MNKIKSDNTYVINTVFHEDLTIVIPIPRRSFKEVAVNILK